VKYWEVTIETGRRSSLKVPAAASSEAAAIGLAREYSRGPLLSVVECGAGAHLFWFGVDGWFALPEPG